VDICANGNCGKGGAGVTWIVSALRVLRQFSGMHNSMLTEMARYIIHLLLLLQFPRKESTPEISRLNLRWFPTQPAVLIAGVLGVVLQARNEKQGDKYGRPS
jgi:hypothetical protein